MRLIPIVTEKALRSSAEGTYVFRVPLSATKPMIATAVAKTFGVNVRRVTTLRAVPEKIRFKRLPGTKQGYKKAIVALIHGERIPGFEFQDEAAKKDQKKDPKARATDAKQIPEETSGETK